MGAQEAELEKVSKILALTLTARGVRADVLERALIAYGAAVAELAVDDAVERLKHLLEAVAAAQWPTPTSSRRSGLQTHGKEGYDK